MSSTLNTESFKTTLAFLSSKLSVTGAPKQYVIFGSASLILRGILDREPGDIDMFVSKRIWGKFLPDPRFHVETPNAGDPPILISNTSIPISMFFDWSNPYIDVSVPDLIRNADVVNGWRVVPVEMALRMKERAYEHGVTKHEEDIYQIKEWLNGNR